MHPQTKTFISPLTSAKHSALFCHLMIRSKLIHRWMEAEWGYRGPMMEGASALPPCGSKEHRGTSTHFSRKELAWGLELRSPDYCPQRVSAGRSLPDLSLRHL